MIQKIIKTCKWCLVVTTMSVLLGCSLVKKPMALFKRKAPKMESTYAMGKVNVADREAYGEGGGVVVIPFVPGDQVPADQSVNRASLMMVKGVVDGLQSNDHYIFLKTDDADLADVIVEGVIDQWRVPSKWRVRRWRNKAELVVSVRMVDRYTDDLIMKATLRKTKKYSEDVFDKMAYEIGQDIALHLTLSQRGVNK